MRDLAIARAPPEEIAAQRRAYVRLLVDAVDSGGGMGFLPPLAESEAEAYWSQVAQEVAAGTRIVLGARAEGELVGSAQLDLCQRPNGLHRAEVQKVMVHHSARRRGIGLALMRAVEEEARARGRSTLFLDTFSHEGARRMYEAAGWTHVGDIPAFARLPAGGLGATSYYYRLLDV